MLKKSTAACLSVASAQAFLLDQWEHLDGPSAEAGLCLGGIDKGR